MRDIARRRDSSILISIITRQLTGLTTVNTNHNGCNNGDKTYDIDAPTNYKRQ